MPFTRRGFLAFLGAAAGSAVAAPLLARFTSDTEVVKFTRIEMQDLNSVMREVYGKARLEDLVYKENPFLKLVERG